MKQTNDHTVQDIFEKLPPELKALLAKVVNGAAREQEVSDSPENEPALASTEDMNKLIIEAMTQNVLSVERLRKSVIERVLALDAPGLLRLSAVLGDIEKGPKLPAQPGPFIPGFPPFSPGVQPMFGPPRPEVIPGPTHEPLPQPHDEAPPQKKKETIGTACTAEGSKQAKEYFAIGVEAYSKSIDSADTSARGPVSPIDKGLGAAVVGGVAAGVGMLVGCVKGAVEFTAQAVSNDMTR